METVNTAMDWPNVDKPLPVSPINIFVKQFFFLNKVKLENEFPKRLNMFALLPCLLHALSLS